MILAVAAGIAVSLALYGLAAVIITRYNAPAFIVTLAQSTAARGLSLMYTNAKVIKSIGEIVVLGQGKFFGIIPYPVIFTIVIAVLTWVILTQTRLGKYLYAIGGNIEAAKAAGINTKSVVIKAFIIHGVFVGIAGTLFMARINSGQPAEAVALEFSAITAAIIGGTSLMGGIGTITGTVIGSMIIGMIANILTLLHVQSYYQQIVTGIIIVAAVVVDIKTKGAKK
jgi:inositol transport system permease protein